MVTNALAARSDAVVLLIPSNSLEGNAKLASLNTGQNRTRSRMVTMAGSFERTRSGSMTLEEPPPPLLLLIIDEGPIAEPVAGGAAPVSPELALLLRRCVAVVSVMVSDQ